MKAMKSREYLILLIRFFLPLMLVAVVLIALVLSARRRVEDKQLRMRAYSEVVFLGERIAGHFRSIRSDIEFLPVLNELLRYKTTASDQDRAGIEAEFIEFSRCRQLYDQIRYLDSKGMERIRVNLDPEKGPYAVSKANLANKGNRYYFAESIGLHPTEIYVSSLDLNIEHGKVEEPKKPMIRFSTPIHDGESLKGVLVLNYLAADFLEEIQRATRQWGGEFQLLNEEGYWLVSRRPDQEWGFMYPQRGIQPFSASDPLFMNIQYNQSGGQFVHKGKLYSCLQVQPFRGVEGVVNAPAWYLIHTVELATWAGFVHEVSFHSSFAAVLVVVISGVLAYSTMLRTQYREALRRSALYDSLTELPNRRLLTERANQLIRESKRNRESFALFFVDLDGFKKINDTYGHEAGDHLLKQIAQRLRVCVRESDTVSRIGGDEFVVLLPRIREPDDCGPIAQKIIDAVGEFDIEAGRVHIGASIGIVIAANDGSSRPDLHELLRQADDAMYRVKDAGKGKYQFAT